MCLSWSILVSKRLMLHKHQEQSAKMLQIKEHQYAQYNKVYQDCF